MPDFALPDEWLTDTLREGQVIPAHPLALTDERKLDERRQRALTRYYHAAGAGGIAVGVHTTQFEIREHGMLEPVLKLAAETARECDKATGRRTILIAGSCGPTRQATGEAHLAARLGYHATLLSLGALHTATDDDLIDHCRTVARELPLVGFYLQPAVGGRILSFDFWRRFAEIPNVVAIKIAPFDRYRTLDVMRAVADVGRAGDIALYTGNDDNIVVDLLTPFLFNINGREVRLRIAGGLLGHWACWTHSAVSQLRQIKAARVYHQASSEMLTLAAQITDANAAFFDPQHAFAGSIAGIHEVLYRQGLLANRVCLNPKETLSPGQRGEIQRVYQAYPHLNDDAFVAEHRKEWLG